jgi:hypothetical protein
MDAEDRKRRQNDELAREDEAVQALIAAARAENDRDGATERITTLVEEHRIGHSRLNVKFSDARGLQLTIAAALLSDLAAHDVRFTAAISGLAAALERVRILKDDELEVFDVMLNLSFGSIYRVWLDEPEIIEALPADRDADAHRRTLANMKARGILEEGAGKWRALR